MQNTNAQRRPIWIWIAALIAAILWLLRYRRRRQRKRRRVEERAPRRQAPARAVPIPVQGLSQAEAEARRVEGQSNDIQFEARRSAADIWRENVLSIFNANLLGLAIAIWVLGKPFDALVTLGVLLLNIGLNVGQEVLARKRLDKLLVLTRPKATVIREGKAKSIDPDEIVAGDALVVGPGDYVLVDGEVVGRGQIIVDESILTGQLSRQTKGPGDTVYAGSYCASGRAAYEAKKVGPERLIASLITGVQSGTKQLTELQRLMDLILRILLAIVAFFAVIVMAEYFLFRGLVLDEAYRNAMSVIFAIAPAGLFFGVVVGYAVGARDMARKGALVHRFEAVESLAYVNVLCFGTTGTLTGTEVHLEYIDPPIDHEGLEEDRVRRILADYVHSTAASGPILRTLADALTGNRRPVQEEAPFLSLSGWSAIAFDDVDLRGTYVLGDPETIRRNLIMDIAPQPDAEPEAVKEETTKPTAWKRFRSRVGGFFGRSNQVPENDGAGDASDDQSAVAIVDQPLASPPRVAGEEQAPADVSVSGEEGQEPTGFRGLLNRMQRFVRRSERAPEEDTAKEAASEQLVLLFAYRPDVSSLQDGSGQPQLPVDLVPLCLLRFSEEIRPEARETVKAFTEAGVDVKILSADNPDTVAATARELGLGEDEEMPLRVVSGSDLDALGESAFARTAAQATVFGQLTPEQKGEVVRTLHEQRRYVAMVGSGVDDVSALRQADLAVAMQGGSQAALGVASIVLLGDSLTGLSAVLRGGQRIVNGTLNILKLNLTQISYLVLLLIAVSALNVGLPYHPSQGGIIALATLTIPAVALSFWAPARALPEGGLAGSLARFVLPAGIATSICTLAVYLIFEAMTQDTAYAQVAVTYLLTACGLLLFVFVQPATRAWVLGQVPTGDRRPLFLAIGLFVVYVVFTGTQLAYFFFKLFALREPAHYLLVGVVVFFWAVALLSIWRTRLLERYLRVDFSEPGKL